eukprot:TRINITY_DN3153_c0_g1_i1.p1 TRINITY_DN3153_c0_g1~~TRINITY_DN3153_c0_g1_i1.p1  ORF type:complete len:528 (+),score=150.97 TRINITY_DN3153_c0_g1_i1:104-1687(+)
MSEDAVPERGVVSPKFKSKSDVTEFLNKQLSNRSDKQTLIDRKILKDPDSIQFKGETLMVKLAHRRTPSTLAKLNVIKEFDAEHPEANVSFGQSKEKLEKQIKKDKLTEFIGKRKTSQESILRQRIVVDEAETMAASDVKDDSLPDLGALPQPMRRSTAADCKVLEPKRLSSGLIQFNSVGAGWAHTILRDVHGRLHSVGTGSNGRLGLGSTVDITSFTEIKELENVSSFAVADNHNVALSGGKVYTWGDGTWSKLGHDDVDDKLVPAVVKAFEGIEIVQVAAGGYHSLAVSSSGELFAWGWGKGGRLGVPPSPEIETDSTWVEPLPKSVKFPDGVKIVKAAAGQSSSAAISSEGHLYTWGSGRWGALGLGLSEDDQILPVIVESLKNEQVVDISIGDSHMIVFTKSNKVYTWGRNDYGQLGRTEQKQDGVPAEVVFPEGGVTAFVAAGKSHSLAVVGGTLFSWGNNSAGQLGQGSTGKEKVPRPVALPASPIVCVSAGWSHTLAVLADGSAYGFGSNLKSQLGSSK